MTTLSPAVTSLNGAVNPIQLGAALARLFNLEEIETLCFDLEFEYEELGEGGRTTKAIRLVKSFERAGRIEELAEALLAERPELTWEALGREAESGANQADGSAPYKGLAFFDVADAEQFYGRDELTAELVRQLLHHSFLAVVGASGSGKSSIVRAGLIPALQGRKSLSDLVLPDGCVEWPLHIITPTDDPLLALAASLAATAGEALTLRESLLAGPEHLKLALQFKLKHSSAERLLLFVDQFEEIFTQCKDETIRRAFIDNLMVAAAGPAVVVITLRADYYAACAAYDNLREILSHQQLYIGPMNRAELRAAIEKPAERFGWKFESGLVDLLLEDIGASENRSPEPGALPLLSHALLETWKRREGVTMTLTGYIASGGIRGAIAQTAEEVYQYRLRPEQQAIARRIFLRLTEVGETAQDTRRRATFSEMIHRNREEVVIEAVLLILTDARLVMVDLADDENEKIVQVTHEALIREWPQLREWLDESRDDLRIQRQITSDTLNWLRLKQDPGALYRGARLAGAVEWLQNNAQSASRVERAFIGSAREASLAEERRREAVRQRELQMARELAATQTQAARRLRWMVWATAGAALVLLLLAGVLARPRLQNWLDRRAAMGEMIMYPAGPVILGTVDADLIEAGYSPQETVELDAFALGKYEVSNDHYRLCEVNDVCTLPADPTAFFAADKGNHPVTYVTIFQANTYCAWLGQRLPTAAEWERAARGTEGALWPWGSAPPSQTTANMYNESEAYIPLDTRPVNSHPGGATADGMLNLIGNVWEWTSSKVREEISYDRTRFWDGSEANFNGTDSFVQKGGGWDYETEGAFADSFAFGSDADADTGFRCAQSLESIP